MGSAVERKHYLFKIRPLNPLCYERLSMKATNLLAIVVAISVLAACGKREEQLEEPTAQSSVPAPQLMDQHTAAIRSCMQDGGLSEETCVGVYRQMMSGQLQGTSTKTSCEAQHGAGACQQMSVASPGGGETSIFVPMLIGVAAGYLASNFFRSNTVMPSSAVYPTQRWTAQQPHISRLYDNRRAQQQTTVVTLKPPVTTGQPQRTEKSFVPNDGYGKKTYTVNGQQVQSGNALAMPKQVIPTQPTQKVEQRPAVNSFVQRPAQQIAPPAPPKVTYNTQSAPAKPSYNSGTTSSGGGRRR